MTPSRARLLSIYTPQAWFGAGQYFAPNPDFAAAIEYFLPGSGREEIPVRITDARGTLVRALTGTARAGVNRVTWDLRMEPPIPSAAPGAAAAAAPLGGALAGPLVLPGVYTVTVGAQPKALKGELKVEGDPRVAFPDGDRRARQTALLELYDLVKSLAAGRAAAASAIAHAETAAGKDPREEAADAERRLRALQTDLATQINAAMSLSRSIEGYSGLPTADQRRQIEWAFEDAQQTIAGLNRALHTDSASAAAPLSIPRRH